MKRWNPIFWDIETTGVNPLAEEWHDGERHDAKVIAVSLARLDEGWREADTIEDVEVHQKILKGEEEYEMLEASRELCMGMAEEIRGIGTEENQPFLTSWNGRKFDHPYIAARYSRFRQDPGPFGYSLKRLDMMRAAAVDCGMPGYGVKQDDYAEGNPDKNIEGLGITVEDDTTGADMLDMYEESDWDGISYHVKEDVSVMVDIFIRRKDMFMDHFYGHYDLGRDANTGDMMDFGQTNL